MFFPLIDDEFRKLLEQVMQELVWVTFYDGDIYKCQVFVRPEPGVNLLKAEVYGLPQDYAIISVITCATPDQHAFTENRDVTFTR